jgi:hypothetical protein
MSSEHKVGDIVFVLNNAGRSVARCRIVEGLTDVEAGDSYAVEPASDTYVLLSNRNPEPHEVFKSESAAWLSVACEWARIKEEAAECYARAMKKATGLKTKPNLYPRHRV